MRTKNLFLRILCVTALLSVIDSALIGQKTLYMTEKNGSVNSFSISEIRKLTFPDGNMTVTRIDGTSKNFPVDAIAVLKFSAPVSIENLKVEKFKASLYPNPLKDHFYLSFESDKTLHADIQIYDLNGRVLYSQNSEVIAGKNLIDINVETLTNGLYLCSLRLQEKTINLKFNINR
jgi:hypothetical protein